MPIEVTIRIHSDEDGNISDLEKNVLASLAGGADRPIQTVVFNGFSPDPAGDEKPLTDVHSEAELAEAKEEAEKPAEAPRRKRRTKAEIEADEAAKKAAEEAETPKADEDTAPSSVSEDADPVAEETSTEPDGQPTGEAEKVDEGPTVEQAVARAAKFMREGRGPEAKAALDRVGNGAERVSKLNPKDVPAYMAALDELEAL